MQLPGANAVVRLQMVGCNGVMVTGSPLDEVAETVYVLPTVCAELTPLKVMD